MSINFVSISAVTDGSQLEEISKIYHGKGLSFPLAIGYQVSNKSINQGTQNTRQPRFVDLASLDRETRNLGFITAVHYYTRDNGTIIEDLERVIGSGVKSSLLQLNTLPSSLDILEKAKDMGFRIIFKVAVSNKQSSEGGYAIWKGENVQDVSSGQVDSLVNQVYDRRCCIDYAMFDPSHGTNLNLDLDENTLAIRFGKRIIANKELNHLGLVYAGGIKPSNIRQLTRMLYSFFPNRFSIDVESGVRTEDKLDLGLVRKYLVGCRDEVA